MTLPLLRAGAILWLLASSPGCVSQFAITQPLEANFPRPLVVSIGDIGVAVPLDTQAGKKPGQEELQMFERFLYQELAKAGIPMAQPGAKNPATLQVQGSLIEFKRGNGFARFFVGPVAAASVTANLRLVEPDSGRVVFAGNFVGVVAGWSFGEEAFRRAATGFAAALLLEFENRRQVL